MPSGSLFGDCRRSCASQPITNLFANSWAVNKWQVYSCPAKEHLTLANVSSPLPRASSLLSKRIASSGLEEKVRSALPRSSGTGVGLDETTYSLIIVAFCPATGTSLLFSSHRIRLAHIRHSDWRCTTESRHSSRPAVSNKAPERHAVLGSRRRWYHQLVSRDTFPLCSNAVPLESLPGSAQKQEEKRASCSGKHHSYLNRLNRAAIDKRLQREQTYAAQSAIAFPPPSFG